ncbi:hypothetical protein AVEN_106966-1 [Araneus ventricosus]|uniref:Uncharacterized protein n=1 Tax=Araneus ventricosus TaxID=182803 RepID=A0A4Y2Q7W8_ARAVE|nr:hypothetical protein AVEN_106966-1 [Araneus ventricosus]
MESGFEFAILHSRCCISSPPGPILKKNIGTLGSSAIKVPCDDENSPTPEPTRKVDTCLNFGFQANAAAVFFHTVAKMYENFNDNLKTSKIFPWPEKVFDILNTNFHK